MRLVDNKTFYFCNTTITFNTDLNNHLILGTQQLGFSGRMQRGIGTRTQLPVQNPQITVDPNNIYCDFTIVGQFILPYLIGTTSYYETTRVSVNMITGESKVWYMTGNNP